MEAMRILTTLSFLLAATCSFGGAFDGPSIQFGVGGSRSGASLDGDNHLANTATTPLNGLSSSDGSLNGLVALGYSREIAALSGFNLAANAFYIFGDQDSGSGSLERQLGGFNFHRSYAATLTNTYGISVEPGWNFSESTLGYVKLAWVRSTLEIPNSYIVNATRRDYSLDSTLTGFGYGLGCKRLLSKRAFVGIDLMGVSYPKTEIGSSTDPFVLSAATSQLIGFVSVGYKF